MKNALYTKGSSNINDINEQLPSFLLLGRSNVGKSSFINSLTNRKNLAKTSGTPGKTIVLNYYKIDEEFYLIDAPGYGYAKRSKAMKFEFESMIDNIVRFHPDLISILLIIDFKVGPTKDDLNVYNYLLNQEFEIIVVATKLDKIPSTRRIKREKEIIDLIGKKNDFFAVSNTEKAGIEKVKNEILARKNKYFINHNL